MLENTVVVIQGDTLTDWLMVGITFVGVLATVLIGLLTLVANRRASKAAAGVEEIQLEAVRAALERNNAITNPPASAASASPEAAVRWQIVGQGSTMRKLVNVGSATALGVRIDQVSGDENQSDIVKMVEGWVSLAPGAELPFHLVRTFGSAPVTILEIRWKDESDEEFSEQRILT